MDHFERELTRMMRDSQEYTPFEAEDRVRLRAGVQARRRVRTAQKAAGSFLAVAGLGIGFFMLPHDPGDDRPQAPHPIPATSPVSPSPSPTDTSAPPSATATETPTGSTGLPSAPATTPTSTGTSDASTSAPPPTHTETAPPGDTGTPTAPATPSGTPTTVRASATGSADPG
ncbi:hypothetical protein [Streptomyces sp. NPDC057616]|uniref:hypothetical protein n=1 Tax=Streptomyces sp. NPDC057616 TaxID=3346183 RepID=UPI0036B609FA